MFDPDKSNHIQQLSDELNNNPEAMLYNLNKGIKFNLRQLNNGNKNTQVIEVRKTLTVARLYRAMDFVEFEALNATEERYVLNVLSHDLDDDISFLESDIDSIFGSESVTMLAIVGQLRQLSRAEVLWGEGSVISGKAFTEARDL